MKQAEPVMAPRAEWAPAAAPAATPAAARVTFADAHRPEEATIVRLESFDGPLALLLALVEQRQLDVLTVRLGDLCAAYLDALARLDIRRMPLLSAFISVSAQLIVIKSRALLPRPPDAAATEMPAEGEDPQEELRQRLILYRLYRDAGTRLGETATSGPRLFHRDGSVAIAAARAGARAPAAPPLDAAILAAALRGTAALLPPPEPPPESMPRTITLAERADLLRTALRGAPRIVLQELLRDVRDRVVVAVTFMALLEMVKGGEVAIEQRQPWGPISVRSRAVDG